jgi:divalent metal cation (Fe/Co/Zn/Cd) transporter
MKNILAKHYPLWSQKSFLVGVIIGLIFLALSLFINYWANFYVTEHISNSVTDILLDNLPTVNVDIVFSEGAMIFLLLMILTLLYEPKCIPFTLKAIALFILIRSIFMILTHLAPPLHGSYVDAGDIIYKLSSGDDLFFSAHTGLPFMLALTFWGKKYLRYFFLICSVIGAASVILGHLHYSIDVFSAFFIAYGIFHLAREFFKKDYKLLVESL